MVLTHVWWPLFLLSFLCQGGQSNAISVANSVSGAETYILSPPMDRHLHVKDVSFDDHKNILGT